MRIACKLAAVPATFLILSCGGDDTNASQGSGQGQIVESVIFSVNTYLVESQQAAWSPNGQLATFEASGGGSGDVYTVNVAQGGTPLKATDANAGYGGEGPGFLEDGRLVYYQAFPDNGNTMHFMAASTGLGGSWASPAILHSFNGTHVGMSAGASSSPGFVTFSKDGNKFIYGRYLLDWSSGSLVSTLIQEAHSELVISPEGRYLAWKREDGTIDIKDLQSQQTWQPGSGAKLSWASNGRLGYAVQGAYKVYTLQSGVTRTYATARDLVNQGWPSLSPDATRILLRDGGGAYTGLSVGTLKE